VQLLLLNAATGLFSVRNAVFSVEQQESSHSTYCRHIFTHRAGNMLQLQHKTES